MSRLLTIFIEFHWSALFALLAVDLVFRSRTDATGVLLLFGLNFGSEPMPGHRLAVAGLTLLFALCAVLFLWALATTALAGGDGDDASAEVIGKAFATASLAMTVVLAYGIYRSAGGLVPVIAMHYAALLSSFVAVRIARPAETAGRHSDVAVAFKAKAIEASHASRLVRLSPIPVLQKEERR